MMKRITIVLLSLLVIMGFLGLTGMMIPEISPTAPAQAAPEARGETRVVLAERFTATWCGFCPNAAGGLAQLQNEVGIDNLVALAYHVSDDLATTDTEARATAYGVSGIPDVFFDATLRETGAGSVSGAYTAYKGHYDARRAVSSNLKMESGGTISGNQANIEVQIEAVGSVSGSFNLRYVLYEDSISLGGDTYNNVVRSMKSESISASDFPLSKSTQFTIDGTWSSGNLGAAVFVQTGTNGEVLQAKYEDFNGPLNQPPVVKPGAKTEITSDEDVVIELNLGEYFSDPESDTLSYDVDTSTHFDYDLTSPPTLKLTPALNWYGTEDVTVKAQDSEYHDWVSHTIKIIVSPVNDAPIAIEDNLDFSMAEDSIYREIKLNDVFSDPEEDDLTYSVTGNTYLTVNIMSDSTAEIDSTGEFAGKETITFVATDPSGDFGTKDVTVSVSGKNDMPEVKVFMDDITFNEDEIYDLLDLSVHFVDPDGDKLYFSYEGNKNIGIDIDTNGLVTFTPRKNWNGKEVITFKATDKLSPNVEEDVTVKVEAVNDPPVPVEVYSITIIEDIEYTYLFEATDIENDPLTFDTNIRSKVKGLVLNDNYFFNKDTGEMTITATNEMVGVYTVQLTADDGDLTSDPIEFKLTIENLNDAPRDVKIISPETAKVYDEGESIVFIGTAEDDDENVPTADEKLTYLWKSDIDGTLGQGSELTYSDLSVGEHTITLEVRDNMNEVTSASVTITVKTQGGGGGPDSSTPSDLGAGDDSWSSNLWWIIAAIVITIIVVVLITVMFMAKKKPELTPEEKQLNAYYDQLQQQGMLEQSPAMYGYQHQPMMAYGAYPQQQQMMMQQQPMVVPQQPFMQQPQAAATIQPQAPAPAQEIRPLQPSTQAAPQLPPARDLPQDLPKTKPVTNPQPDTPRVQANPQPKDWNWNY
ncbi:MAG: tandem-95 repeat protein [Thermoplasmata archaeon]|nr:MAG: tandem-95 repeat protein [Thermoplasmata archaeon]